MTLGNLLAKLRIRLNDTSDGQWTANEKRDYLNNARLRTLIETRSYIGSQSITVVAGTHTYDSSPVFIPKAVRLCDDVLEPRRMDSMAMIAENWDALPEGIPTVWIPTGGSRFRVSRTPSVYAASRIGTIAKAPTAPGTGYKEGELLRVKSHQWSGDGVVDAILDIVDVDGSGGVLEVSLSWSETNTGRRIHARGNAYAAGAGKTTQPTTGSGTGCTVNITALAKLEVYGPASVDDLTSDNDEINEISEARSETILLAAEEEAWRARPSMAGSAARAEVCHNVWLLECEKIRTELGIV